ncbi:Gfo/Idh/MocA family oxidoreductase [Paenibacillus sp. MMS20-IR301]|uniref:Gfo/Idh/MocA family protein n=1 Tax=Paenibacillus sp. MMS20-IR301 TaxID=2895946 RepID=UPI0028E6E751|nr:Gfo/Idh/MocA family oxidoreductase [Paenibacillus sp. MMS20-IR301]WNS43996.1 Gfo/Idh/MocA family oxidoreductase [Paenibacillus sp. MMS20-IR301]
MINKLKYALIGAGGNAEKKHIHGYLALEDVEVAAICDIDAGKAARMAEKYNVPGVYTDYKEMFAHERPDIVSIVTPNFLHAEITEYALAHGAHVHCEKPLSISSEEAARIIAARDRYGKQVMIGLNNRFLNEAVFLKKWIDDGNLGKIYNAKAGWVRRAGIPGRGTWFTDKDRSGGGVLIDLGAHYLDLALYFMGLPRAKYVAGSIHQNFVHTTARNRNGYRGIEGGLFNVEDAATGYLGLENSASLSFDFSWASNIEEDRFYVELMGSRGGASLVNGTLKLFGESSDICLDITPKLKLNPALQLKNEFRHFVDCIKGQGGSLIAPAEDGLYFAEIVDAFYESAAAGGPVLLNNKQPAAAVI